MPHQRGGNKWRVPCCTPRDEPRAFTLSVHCQSNFPARKATSTLDIGLPDGTGGAASHARPGLLALVQVLRGSVQSTHVCPCRR